VALIIAISLYEATMKVQPAVHMWMELSKNFSAHQNHGRVNRMKLIKLGL